MRDKRYASLSLNGGLSNFEKRGFDRRKFRKSKTATCVIRPTFESLKLDKFLNPIPLNLIKQIHPTVTLIKQVQPTIII